MRLKKEGKAKLSVPYIYCPFINQNAARFQQIYIFPCNLPDAVLVIPRRVPKLNREVLQISIG
jgi:hypothetical protein